MTRRHRHLLLALAAALPCAACGGPEPFPFAASGRWRPGGSNEANLRAMVFDPAHIERGQDALRRDAQAATAAVARHRSDRVRPLPRTSTSALGVEEGGDGR